LSVGSDMKNPYIISAAIIGAAILAGFWMLKPSSKPQKVIVVQPPKAPDISIHDAAFNRNIEAVKKHLAAGADVNAKDFVGATALHNAVRVKVGETTAANKDVAAQKEIIELLIAAGADVNAKDMDGETPLDWAIKYKRTETADLLRKHGGKTGEELKAEGK